MPVGPQKIFDQLSLDYTSVAIKTIDSCLLDPEWVKNWRYGTPDKPYWKIICKGEANYADKVFLIRQYTQAGWSMVEVLNSSENNERAGLSEITLYK